MTKNRKHKQAVRAAQETTGGNYTTARRALAAQSAQPDGASPDVPVVLDPHRDRLEDLQRAEHVHDPQGNCIKRRNGPHCDPSTSVDTDPFLLPLGTDPDGTPVHLHLGDPNAAPVTWVTGVTGSGKSVVVHQVVAAFLDANPHGRVLWLDPKGIGPEYADFDERVHVLLDVTAPETADAFITVTSGRPTLCVIEELPILADYPGENPLRLRRALEHIARTGRSTGIRLLATFQQPPSVTEIGPVLARAVHARVLVGHTNWANWCRYFEIVDDQLEAEATDTGVGRGWVRHGAGDIQRVHFPAPNLPPRPAAPQPHQSRWTV